MCVWFCFLLFFVVVVLLCFVCLFGWLVNSYLLACLLGFVCVLGEGDFTNDFLLVFKPVCEMFVDDQTTSNIHSTLESILILLQDHIHS